MCNCTDHIHSFACYLRNISTDANRTAMNAGTKPNAR